MSDLEPIQRSRLGEIGQLLAKAREEKGLTLEEVSGKTLIRAAILKAIEEGDERPLPEPVYIRGFIRRFGDLVGLNGMELCDSFPWQPSGSVPLSFVSAGNIVAASPASQKSPEAEISATPEPEVEPVVGEVPEAPELESASPVDIASVAASEIDAPLEADSAQLGDGAIEPPDHADSLGDDSVDAPAMVEAEASVDLAVETPPTEVSLGQEELEPEEVVEVQGSGGAESSPDHEAAYESRAALFDESEESGAAGAAVAGGAAAIAATVPAVMSQSSIDNVETATLGGSEISGAAASGTSGTGVATLPPPPAPVMYREPEQRNLMPWILAVVAGAVGLGIAVLSFSGNNNRQNIPTAESDSSPTEQVETAASGAASTDASGGDAAKDTSPSTPAQAAVPADKVVLELEVKGTEDAWMDVFVDGELQIEGNQVPGFKQRWEGDKEIELATARPDMVWISVNGSKPQPFGKFEEAKPVKIGGFKPANAQ